jgi:hypothetical protein
MSVKKKIMLLLLVILIGIQFIPPARNTSSSPTPGDIFELYPAGEDTKQLIRTACYNCHSNNTAYPWYAHVQPVGWWLAHHIDEARAELNFSEFSSYKAADADHKLEEVAEEVKEKAMPLKAYTWMHKDARLTDKQRNYIIAWAEDTRKQIK